MIIIDWPLGATAILFFVISWLYAHGLLRFFSNRFAWDLASVVGIASIVSCTYTLVWLPRLAMGYDPIPDLIQIPYDLAVIFMAALPGMTWVRVKLQKKTKRLQQRVLEQAELLAVVERVATRESEKCREQIDELISIFEMRREQDRLWQHLNHIKMNDN